MFSYINQSIFNIRENSKDKFYELYYENRKKFHSNWLTYIINMSTTFFALWSLLLFISKFTLFGKTLIFVVLILYTLIFSFVHSVYLGIFVFQIYFLIGGLGRSHYMNHINDSDPYISGKNLVSIYLILSVFTVKDSLKIFNNHDPIFIASKFVEIINPIRLLFGPIFYIYDFVNFFILIDQN